MTLSPRPEIERLAGEHIDASLEEMRQSQRRLDQIDREFRQKFLSLFNRGDA